MTLNIQTEYVRGQFIAGLPRLFSQEKLLRIESSCIFVICVGSIMYFGYV